MTRMASFAKTQHLQQRRRFPTVLISILSLLVANTSFEANAFTLQVQRIPKARSAAAKASTTSSAKRTWTSLFLSSDASAVLAETTRTTASSTDWEAIAAATSNLMLLFQNPVAQDAAPLFSAAWWTDLSADCSILFGTLPEGTQTFVTVVLPVVHVIFAVVYRLAHPTPGYRAAVPAPYARGHYDAEQARLHYQQHPLLVLQRLLEILRLARPVVEHWVLDNVVQPHGSTPLDTATQRQRAQDMTHLCTQLGAAAIKVGQALSVRTDLISPILAEELARLQDNVPPIPARVAHARLHDEWGAATADRVHIPSHPVAAASIGQVYKVTLGSTTVAVKVQRPNVHQEIALDIYIGRELLAPLYEYIFAPSTGVSDCRGIADEWGRGFISELDYRQEAVQTQRFNQAMAERDMLHVVCAPQVVPALSTEQVLVTEWVEGTRLDDAAVPDSERPRLCAVALNAYMIMLLELSSLHCDPHPGNLMRTDDGRLCILDFGMVLDIDPNLQYSLLAFVAHLTSDNYDDLPQDLVQLGFLAPDQLESVVQSGLLEPMKYFLQQAGAGGGATGVHNRILAEYQVKYPDATQDELMAALQSELEQQIMQSMGEATKSTDGSGSSVASGIQGQMEELQRLHQEAFRMPDWFLYSSRAFLTLEGVSLQTDPDYSLIKSCFPYIAKRLVGDDDPRAAAALKNLVYGATGTIDVKKLTDLAGGFSSFSAASKYTATKKEDKLTEAEATITLAKDSADILFAPEGNLIQNMLVEETSLAASATFKDVVRETLVEGPQRLRAVLPFGFALPPLPFEDKVAPFVQKSEKELKAQELAETMVKMLPETSESELLNQLTDLDPEQAALVVRELRQNLPKYGPMLASVGGKWLSTLLSTASDNIDSTLQHLERTSELKRRPIVRAAIKGVSHAAQQGADAIYKPVGDNTRRQQQQQEKRV